MRRATNRSAYALLCILSMTVTGGGCSNPASLAMSEANSKTDQQEHTHGEGGGSHSHPHTHGHRHGEPLYGGRIVSIGHSHNPNGATHYYAELMPIADGKITFHVVVEDAGGHSKAFPVEADEIVGFVDRLDVEIPLAREVLFRKHTSLGPETLVADIPDDYRECLQLSVVVPKIELGGERLNFSFTATLVDQDQSDGKGEPQIPTAGNTKEPSS